MKHYLRLVAVVVVSVCLNPPFTFLSWIVAAADNNTFSDHASSMPRLPAGKHLGALTSFDAYPPEIQTILDARLAEMRAAVGGNSNPSVHRVQLDWRDLEAGSPGIYDAEPLLEALAAFDNPNDFIFVLLATVDTEGVVGGVRPDDLQETLFADDMLWERWKALLQAAVLPILQSNPRIFLLSIGNEPGGYLEENPDELLPMATFLNDTRQLIHETVPDLAVSLTMDRVFKEIADASDVVLFNHYGLKLDLTSDLFAAIDDPQDFVTALHERQAIFGTERSFVIQELGMPSGWEHQESAIGSTPEFAASVVRVMLQELLDNESWRAAFWFTTVDWSIEVTDLFLGALEGDDSLPAFIVERLEEWLRTGGLLRYQQPRGNVNETESEELTPRPTWNEFLAGLEMISTFNANLQNQTDETDSPSQEPAENTGSPTQSPEKSGGVQSTKWDILAAFFSFMFVLEIALF